MSEEAAFIDDSDLSSEEGSMGSSIGNMCSYEHTDPEDKTFYKSSSSDTTPLVENMRIVDEAEDFNGDDDDENKNSRVKSINSVLKEMLAPEFFVLFYVDCVLWLAQTEFEIFLPFLTEFEYHWSPKYTGCLLYTSPSPRDRG